MTNRLLLGTIDADGHVDPRPVIVTLDANGHVIEWHRLSGHEPHSTTVERALLRLPDQTITKIKN